MHVLLPLLYLLCLARSSSFALRMAPAASLSRGRRGCSTLLAARKARVSDAWKGSDDEQPPEGGDEGAAEEGVEPENGMGSRRGSAAGPDLSSPRAEDLVQNRDLDLILSERSKRFYDPEIVKLEKEKCLLVAVDVMSRRFETKDEAGTNTNGYVSSVFSLQESLSELSELVGTAGLQVMGSCVQKLNVPNKSTYVGPGKVDDIMVLVNATNAKTIVVDDDLTAKQQRNLESLFGSVGGGDVKILDRTALILEIFAQHATSREGQLQVELAMLEYRLTRGPRASGDADRDSGAGFRGPGESKVESDKRLIRDKIVLMKKEISLLGVQRAQHRQSRRRLGIPVVALVGYTNAGKSTLLNRLSKAGVLAENMLFATLDPTTRRVQLPRGSGGVGLGRGSKGQEVFLTDTVGFISKLPTDLVAAFRATLEEVGKADVLVHVCDRSSPVWEKQRETVLRELDAIGCSDTPIVELWNKIDCMAGEEQEQVRLEAATMPVDVDAVVGSAVGKQLPPTPSLVSSSSSSSAAWSSAEAGDDSIALSALDRPESSRHEEDAYEWSEDEEHVRAVAREPEESKYLRSRAGQLTVLRRPRRRTVHVACSVKTGLGFDDFLEVLEDTLALLLRKVKVFVPYAKDDGVIAAIHAQGLVDTAEHAATGTLLSCRVPDALVERLKPFRVRPGDALDKVGSGEAE